MFRRWPECCPGTRSGPDLCPALAGEETIQEMRKTLGTNKVYALPCNWTLSKYRIAVGRQSPGCFRTTCRRLNGSEDSGFSRIDRI